MMAVDIRQRGQAALNQVAEEHLPAVVKWLELLAEMRNNPDAEPEELWLLATGELKQMADEMDEATHIDDWRKYLNDL
jgi:hypothetical protein